MEKKKLGLKKFSLIYFAAVIAVCLLAAIIGRATSGSVYVYQGDGSNMTGMELSKGVYSIDVDYVSDCYGMVTVNPSSELDQWGAFYANAFMPDYTNHVTSTIYVNQSGARFDIGVYPVAEGSFNVSNVSVVRSGSLSATYNALRLLGFLIVLYLVIVVIWILRSKEYGKNRRVITTGLLLLIFVSMIGFMESYIPGGQDAEFHLARIASLSDGLRSGSFPVRIYDNFANDYGYPLGVLYGDLFLYPSAILHVLGMPLWKSYVFYVVLMSALTAVISWFCLGEMTEDLNIGFVGSVIYTLSIWRLNDIYIRAAAGEYGAMAFLPLIVLGFYQLFRDTQEKKNRRTFLYLVVGYFGVIQTHMLTSITVTVFLVVIGLCLCKRILKMSKIILVLKAAGVALLANLCFIVPMLDYYGTFDLTVEHQTTNIQSQGAYLSQLFSTAGNYNDGISASIADSYGISGEMPLGIGLSMLLILIVLILVVLTDPKSKYRTTFIVSGVVSLISLWMSTCYFPYDFISRKLSFLARIINRVQFPWRYSVITTFALTVAAVFLLKYFKDKEKNLFVLVASLVMIITVCQAVSFMSERINQNETVVNALCTDQIASPMIDNDTLYWIQGMSKDNLTSRDITVSGDGITAQITGMNVPKWTISFTNSTGAEGYIEPPILAFKGYHAYYEGKEISVSPGDNYRIRVSVPAVSDGVISIKFKEPVLWRIAEIVSVVTWILLAISLIMNGRKERD